MVNVRRIIGISLIAGAGYVGYRAISGGSDKEKIQKPISTTGKSRGLRLGRLLGFEQGRGLTSTEPSAPEYNFDLSSDSSPFSSGLSTPQESTTETKKEVKTSGGSSGGSGGGTIIGFESESQQESTLGTPDFTDQPTKTFFESGGSIIGYEDTEKKQSVLYPTDDSTPSTKKESSLESSSETSEDNYFDEVFKSAETFVKEETKKESSEVTE